MIHRPSPTLRLATALAITALATGGRMRAEDGAHPAPVAPVEKTAVAPAPALVEHPAHPQAHAPNPPSDHPAAHPPAADHPPTAPEKPAAPMPAADKKAGHARTRDELQSLLKLGQLLTDRGDYDSAEIAFHQLLNSPSVARADIAPTLLALARMHRKQGALTKAVAIYERFLKDYPDSEQIPDALLDLGRSLRALGVYKTALARFYAVINATLKLPGEGFERYQLIAKTAQFEIAETHFQSADFASAAKFYSRLRLLDLAPGDRARAHYKAGYSLRLLGDLENAVTTLRAYLAQWPDDENVPEARYLLAISLRDLKRPQEALTATLELLRTEKNRVAADPKRWAYWQRRTGNHLANDFFEAGDTLNALSIYTGLVELAPEPVWRLPLTYQIALCHERLAAQDRARTAYRAIIEEAGATPPAELAELVRMAKWRLEHLSWRDNVGQQITSFFETSTGKAQPPPPPAKESPFASPKPAAPAPAPAAPTPPTPAKTASLP